MSIVLRRKGLFVYLENDYYLLERKVNLKNDEEVVEFIKNSFPDVEAYSTQGTYIGFWIRFFSHACYPLARPALSSLLGNYVGSSRVKVKLSRYLEAGKISEVKFKTKDMGAAKAFYLPKSEQDLFTPHLPEFMRDMVKVRRTGGIVPGHDYGMGLSILNMMMVQKPFTYAKEVNFSLVNYKKGRGALCVDGIIQFKDEDFTIYLEQDMGTEKIGELVGKLFLYEKHGLCGRRSFVLFSSHEMKAYPSCKSFSAKDLKILLSDMEEKGADNLDVYYDLMYMLADEKVKEVFRALAVRTGYLLAFDGKKRLDAMEIDKDTQLVINKKAEPFTIEELRRYIDELACGNNPYRTRLYNREQSRVANYKFRRMCEILTSLIHQGLFSAGEVRAVLDEGLSCLMYPTTLLSRSYDYIGFHCRGRVVNILKKYYPSITSAEYSASSPLIHMDGSLPDIRLRNCFTLPDGKIICVEHIGKDVGAFTRFYYLNLLKDDIKTPVHLIGLVENDGDINYFSNMTGYRVSMPRISSKDFFIAFMPYNESSGDKLLLPVGYGDDYEVLPIL